MSGPLLTAGTDLGASRWKALAKRAGAQGEKLWSLDHDPCRSAITPAEDPQTPPRRARGVAGPRGEADRLERRHGSEK